MTVTVFMVDGTHNLAELVFGIVGAEVDNPLIGTTLPPLIDTTYATLQQISYPAVDFPMAVSMATGLATLKSDVTALAGGKFMLIGYSQGAGVCSQMLQAMQSGDMTSVYGDCVGAVMFGDICREAGSIATGLTDPGGHGIWTGHLNTSTPAWWQDYVIPLDAACTIRDDVLYEVDLGTLFAAAVGNYLGTGNATHFLLDQWYSGNAQIDLAALGDCLTWVAAVAGVVPFPSWMVNTVAHGLYYNTCPPGSSQTYAELAAVGSTPR